MVIRNDRLRAAGALACLALLAGCNGVPGAVPVPQTPAQAAYALEATYDAALDVAVSYAVLPKCAAGGPALCSDPAMVRHVNAVAHTAWAAIRAAETVARATQPDTTAQANAQAAAQAALGALVTLVATLKVS